MKKFYKLLNKSLKENKCKNIEELWLKLKSDGFDGFAMDLLTEFEQDLEVSDKGNKEENSFNAIFSTADEDRHGDIVVQNWDLKSFKKNTVYLDSHNYDSIEHIIGKIKGIKIDEKGRLAGKIEFALENPKGLLAFKLAKDGFLNTSSVGFIPKEFDNEGKILRSELLEISAVSVPANANALYEKYGITDDTKTKEVKKDKKEKSQVEKDFEKITKTFENWDETNEEIRFKLRDLHEFERGTIERKAVYDTMPRIFCTFGKLAGENKTGIQMLFFPKQDGWTMDDAKKWFTIREYGLIVSRSFEKKEVKKKEVKEVKTLKDKIIEIANRENEAKKQALGKVLKAIKLIETSTSKSKDAEMLKKQETKKIVNKVIRNLLKIKN